MTFNNAPIVPQKHPRQEVRLMSPLRQGVLLREIPIIVLRTLDNRLTGSCLRSSRWFASRLRSHALWADFFSFIA